MELNNVGHFLDKMKRRYHSRLMAGDICKSTADNANRSYKRLAQYWREIPLSGITTDGWDDFQDWYAITYPLQDFSNQLKFFRTMVKTLFNDGTLDKKPELRNRFAKAERLRRRRNKSKIFSKDELYSMFNDPVANQLLLDCCAFYCDCAMRFSEVPALTWKRVNIDSGDPWVYFSETDHKANYEAWVPLSKRCLEILVRRREDSHSGREIHLLWPGRYNASHTASIKY